MGIVTRSENSLNQHIKLKHSEFWDKIKHSVNENKDTGKSNKNISNQSVAGDDQNTSKEQNKSNALQ